jgi:catechol 2,3-dioxygenase-like lactoylglutathione lyase family enzyme
LEQAIRRLRENNVAIEEGPIERTGAMGTIRSIYVRDPDGNLLEISEYAEKA